MQHNLMLGYFILKEYNFKDKRTICIMPVWFVTSVQHVTSVKSCIIKLYSLFI